MGSREKCTGSLGVAWRGIQGEADSRESSGEPGCGPAGGHVWAGSVDQHGPKGGRTCQAQCPAPRTAAAAPQLLRAAEARPLSGASASEEPDATPALHFHSLRESVLLRERTVWRKQSSGLV